MMTPTARVARVETDRQFQCRHLRGCCAVSVHASLIMPSGTHSDQCTLPQRVRSRVGCGIADLTAVNPCCQRNEAALYPPAAGVKPPTFRPASSTPTGPGTSLETRGTVGGCGRTTART